MEIAELSQKKKKKIIEEPEWSDDKKTIFIRAEKAIFRVGGE